MTSDEFAERLRHLVGEAENAGLSREQLLDVLEEQAQAIRGMKTEPTRRRPGSPGGRERISVSSMSCRSRTIPSAAGGRSLLWPTLPRPMVFGRA